MKRVMQMVKEVYLIFQTFIAQDIFVIWEYNAPFNAQDKIFPAFDWMNRGARHEMKVSFHFCL